MKLSKTVIALGALMSMMAGSAFADDPSPVDVNGGVVHFRGSLTDAACSVNTKSADQTVTLGDHPTKDFKAIGDQSERQAFDIILEDCDTKIASTAQVAFIGAVDSANPELLAVDSTDVNGPTATGIGIKITDEKDKVVKPDGSEYSSAHTLIDGENTLHFKAQYVATAATTTPGLANADANFLMQYE